MRLNSMAMENEHKRPNVLIVHNYYQIPGGEDTVVANEKKLLEAHGHKVTLYSRHNNEIKNMSLLRKMLLPFMTIYNPMTAKEIKRLINKEKIDIVHVHNTLNLVSPSVYYVAVKCKVPVIQTIHNYRLLCPGATFYRNGHICEDCVNKGLGCAIKHSCYRNSRIQTLICVISTLIHRCTGIYRKINYIALTEFGKEKIIQQKQIEAKHVYVKPNFVESRDNHSQNDGFIFVGRLDELKGVKVLIDAWKQMGSDAPLLTLCGTGPLEEWCKKEVEGLNIDFKGFVNHEDAIALISKSKALILPTLWYEGFPMTILEAYSVGTPVICSDLGNAGSVVEEGITGWKFEPDNAKDLIKAVNKYKNISESVIRVYIEKYTAEENYRQLIEIYERAKV